jgi:hypothetical protein
MATPQLIQWYGPEVGTSWNSTKVYRSDTGETGTYNLIATVTPITTTYYWDTSGSSSSWYKIAFYNSSGGTLEGPQSVAFYASAPATLYTNPTELRKFMQFATTDFPIDEDATLLIEQAHVQISADIVGSGTGSTITNAGKLKLLALLLSSSFVCRSLATRALSKGYVAVNMEGLNIVKAYDALLRLSDYYYQKYLEQLAKDTVEISSTQFLSGNLQDTTVQDIHDIMNGLSNGVDYEKGYNPGRYTNQGW